MKQNTELTSKNLKQSLWETLNELRLKKIDAKAANSIAAQSREILRILKLELQIVGMAQKKPTKTQMAFLE